MTGFAAHRAITSAGELTVTLRSVNHRGLDIHFHAPADFAPFENEIRALLKRSVARGHIELRLALERAQIEPLVRLNREVLAAYVEAFRDAAHALQLSSQPDLNLMLTLRGVVEENGRAHAELPPEFRTEILSAVETCAGDFNRHREREGEELRSEIARLAAEITSAAEEVARLRECILPNFEAKLRARIADLVGVTNLNETRILEEAALLTERSDIQEEIVRLRVHAGELEALITAGGEIGKPVDFLLQEMNRETNTMLAKSANAGEAGLQLTTLGLAVKAKIEKMREQALNLE